MRWRYLIIALIVIFAFFLYTGNQSVTQTVSVGQCTASFETGALTVTEQSTLCPSPPCTAEPADQQHNAVVDALLCACDDARPGYADSGLNQEIRQTVETYFGFDVPAQEACEGGFLVKRAYG